MIVEAFFVTTSNGTIAYELKNLTTLGKYKTNVMRRNCASLLFNELMVLADNTKPYLYVYQLNKADEELSCRIMLQFKPNVIAILPDATFVIVGVQNEVQLLHVASQQVYCCLKKHFQNITVIKCSSDSSLFATGGSDGMVIVWNLSKILQNSQDPQQIYASFSDHVLAIKDLEFTSCHYKPLLATVSSDRSMKIYDLNSKKLLLNVVFQTPLNCVSFNLLDTEVFVGSTKGDIFRLDLSIQPRSNDIFEESASNLTKFSPCHTDAINVIAIGSSNKELVSGSTDQKFVVWSITTGRAMQVVDVKSSIHSIMLTRISKSLFEKSPVASEVLRCFRSAKKQNLNKQQEIAIMDQRGKILITEGVSSKTNTQNAADDKKKFHELHQINDGLFRYCLSLLENKNNALENI